MRQRMEDYLEAIYHLTRESPSARTTAIATHLGVQPASATEMLQKLAAKHLVNYKKYEGTSLTPTGYVIGKTVSQKHATLYDLLTMLRIPNAVADRDACTMEHNLDPVTIAQLTKFVRFMQECPESTPRCLEHFEEYSRTGILPRTCKKQPRRSE